MQIGIRRKIVTMILGVSALALLALGLGTVRQLLSLRIAILDTVRATGGEVAGFVGTSTKKYIRDHIEDLVEGNVRFIEARMIGIKHDVGVLADLATEIASNPENHAVRDIAPPLPGEHGLSAQLLFSKTIADRQALEKDFGRIANIQDYLLSLLSRDGLINTGTVSSVDGYTIDVDTFAFNKFDAVGEVHFEAFDRPWYKAAREADGFVFSEVFEDIYSGEKMVVGAAPYRRNGEFAGVVALGSHLTDLREAVLGGDIGDTGYGFIINERGEMVIGPENAKDEGDLASMAAIMFANSHGLVKTALNGRDVYLAYGALPSLGLSYGAIIDVGEVEQNALETERRMLALSAEMSQTIDDHVTDSIYLLLAILAVVLLLTYLLSMVVSRRFVKPILDLTRGVAEISSGDLDVRLRITTRDEVQTLAESFNKMAADLQLHMDNLARATAEKERIAVELDIARRIQSSMLPCLFPPFPEREEFDIYARMTPAREVGGDLYDFFMVDSDHVAVVVADVCGKGVPAALFMVVVKTLIKNQAQLGLGPDEVFTTVNAKLCENNDTNMFATAFLGIYDIPNAVMRYVNAGHNQPLVAMPDGAYRYLKPKTRHVVLGVMAEADYSQEEMPLPTGSTLILYTDGVTEAFDASGGIYSDGRLEALVNSPGFSDTTLRGLVDGIEGDVENFAKGAEQSDDITLLAFRTFAPGQKRETAQSGS